MGRPRKLNLTLNGDFNYHVVINVSVRGISSDSSVVFFTDYKLYTDTYMHELPSMKVLMKQVSSILKCSEELLVINCITH